MQANIIKAILSHLLSYKNRTIRKPYGHIPSNAVKDFHKHIDIIISEWNSYLATEKTHIKPIDELSEAQKHLNEDKKWNAFFVFVYEEFNPQAVKFFPQTIKLVEKWKNEINLVFFSNIESGKHIPPHHGNNHGVIRAQIGIEIPYPEETGLRVEDKTVQLKERELFVFDDTFEHEAWNKGQAGRTVLIIDSYKDFPYFYKLMNRYLMSDLKKTVYVQSVIEKMKIKLKPCL